MTAGPELILILWSSLIGSEAPQSAPEAPRAAIAASAERFQQEEFQAALDALPEATEGAPDDPYVSLARGAALAGLGQTDDAVAALQASLGAGDPELTRRAHANLGALRLRQAMAGAEDPEAAMAALDQLNEAAGHYLAAARIDPTDEDAVRNLELARGLADQLQRAIDQQQQSQEQQQAQDSADQLSELADQQRQEAQENQQGQEQQDQQQAQQDQRSLSEQTQQEMDNLQQQAASDQQSEESRESLQQAQQQLQEARDLQEQAEQALQEGDQQQASELQEQAAERLQQAAQSAQQAAEQSGEQGEGQEGEVMQAQEGEQGEGEPQGDPLAEQLLEREEEFREQRARARRGRPVPVEKDW